MIPFPNKKYQVIYADPPWEFNFAKRNNLSKQSKDKLYGTMTDDEIVNLPVESMACDDSVLFIWIMNSKLPLALKCIESWGFRYVTVAFTWVKKTNNTYHFGGGNWTRSNPEICLLATKGKPKRIDASVKNLTISHLRKHSQKPDETRRRIETLLGDCDRIELFARQRHEGWDVWGNQLSDNVQKVLNVTL